MPAERFYIDGDLRDPVVLKGVEHHHLAHVMRTRVGEEIEVVNGRGVLAKGRVQTILRNETTVEILSSIATPLPAPRLKLAIPFMRGAKLELVIEKCTELGADSFYLYPAHFSEKKELTDHQSERLQYIAISAMKQCGRLDLPKIQQIPFEEILNLKGTLLFGDTKKANEPEQIQGEIIFITGPEKGFSEKEAQTLQIKGKGVQLNKNILRAETAPIAASVIYTR